MTKDATEEPVHFDWVTHPGEHVAEYLKERDLTVDDLARIAGIEPGLVAGIIEGRERVVPDTAERLQAAFDLHAGVWLSIQARWDEHDRTRSDGRTTTFPDPG